MACIFNTGSELRSFLDESDIKNLNSVNKLAYINSRKIEFTQPHVECVNATVLPNGYFIEKIP